MVGEIPRFGNGSIAIKADADRSLSAFYATHQLGSGALTRLLNMGVPTFNVATTVSLIIAQRLARDYTPLQKPAEELPG